MNDDEVYARARSIVEHASQMPAYLCDDEIWYAAVEEARAELGITERAPVCKYCGDVAPYGDQRDYWIGWHYGRLHRWWWSAKGRATRTKKWVKEAWHDLFYPHI